MQGEDADEGSCRNIRQKGIKPTLDLFWSNSGTSWAKQANESSQRPISISGAGLDLTLYLPQARSTFAKGGHSEHPPSYRPPSNPPTPAKAKVTIRAQRRRSSHLSPTITHALVPPSSLDRKTTIICQTNTATGLGKTNFTLNILTLSGCSPSPSLFIAGSSLLSHRALKGSLW